MFSEKLNYIMMLTRTTNTEIANYLNVNQSLISRFRLGSRIPSENSSYIKDISDYLAKKIKKENLYDKINAINLDTDAPLSESIYNWFNKDSETSLYLTPTLKDEFYYYGDSGKRDAIINLLEQAIQNKCRTIYSYSDENMNWMVNETFQGKWKKYLIELLRQGTKIKIIHSLSRNYDELINAVTMWLPLYLTGNIEPFFIPKLRDGINRRSLIISSNCAVISSSVEDNTDNMLNMFIQNEKAIKSLKAEFKNYLSLANPLLKKELLTDAKLQKYIKEYEKYTKNINNINMTIYIKPLEELVILLPDSKHILISKENSILKAFEPYLKK